MDPSESVLSFQMRKAWLPQLNTEQVMLEKEQLRERFGCEVDFDDYVPPFQSHIVKLVKTMEG